jgi:hypothetical protein
MREHNHICVDTDNGFGDPHVWSQNQLLEEKWQLDLIKIPRTRDALLKVRILGIIHGLQMAQ